MALNIFKTGGMAAIATAMSIGVASAADIAPVVVPVVTPVVVPVAPGFDFAGAYAGVVGTAAFPPGFGGLDWANVQATAGFNIVPGRFLVGAEVSVGAYVLAGTGLAVDVDGRAGVLLGSRVLAYGTAGFGFYGPGFGDRHLNFGGGVEIGVGQRVSLDLAAGGEWYMGGPIYPNVSAGINFHFGR